MMMRLLVWNVRGAASSGSDLRIQHLLRRHKPLVLCLLEPSRATDRLEFFKRYFAFDSAVSSTNNKIWLFWNSDLKVAVESSCDQSVTLSCSHNTLPTPFWASFVYAKTKEHLKLPLWAELCSVSTRVPVGVPWSAVGDFNCLLSVDEKKGGHLYPHRRTTDFRDCVNSCDLIDATAYGSRFTWWNGRRGEAAIWMRLDRFLYTPVWESVFRTSIRHLSKTTSDHSPLLITCDLNSTHSAPKDFVFLNIWVQHDDFLLVVKDSWEAPVLGSPMFVLATKLNRLRKDLARWNKETFGNIFENLQDLEDKVLALEEALQQAPGDDAILMDYKRHMALLQRQIKIEEGFW